MKTTALSGESHHPVTPDGRYFVVRGRLWRMANPYLAAERRDELVKQLMHARRALRHDAPAAGRSAARQRVDDAKQALGERGAVWWNDGAPDYNRKMVVNTPYAAWYTEIEGPRAGTPHAAARK